MSFNAKIINSLVTLNEIRSFLPIKRSILNNITEVRKRIKNIISGNDKRLLVVIGPCSIHSIDSALDYANKLNQLRLKYKNRLEIIMRTYLEKPRTITGWKGLMNDPNLDNSSDINKGIKLSRSILSKINEIGLPTATEFLDIYINRYIVDLISWGSIGARTVESPLHRSMVSSLSCPIGFKNNTDGNINVAVNSVISSRLKHIITSINKYGKIKIYETQGNFNTHIILRGGKVPNYYKNEIEKACKLLRLYNLPEFLVIDFSHGNSNYDCSRQIKISKYICEQIKKGNTKIVGVMIESHLIRGKQKLSGNTLKYGQSITDSCIGWHESKIILEKIKRAVDYRFI